MKRIIYVFALLYSTAVSAQTFTERLILQDNTDSLYLKSSVRSFDQAGNYYFEIKDGETGYVLSNEGKREISYVSTTFGNDGAISTTESALGTDDMPWYYRNAYGVKTLGPVRGTLKKYLSSDNGRNIALTVVSNDSILFYLDGKLIVQNRQKDLDGFSFEHDPWCAFSENGSVIYFIKNGNSYMLYVNGVLKDKSPQHYAEMHINNNGKYTYAEGQKPKVAVKGYEYQYFVHTPDTVLGPVRTVWNTALSEHNGYYYTGDDNGPEYIVLNNKMFKGIDDIKNIVIPDKHHYMYTFGKNGKLNADGKIYDLAYESVYNPAMDTQGNFAFYGLKDYYLYKFVNGKQQDEPLSRYGVRASPVYISPLGSSIHYFKTDDSLYLYQDDELLFPPIGAGDHFMRCMAYDELYYFFKKEKFLGPDPLLYLEYGKKAYFIYKGVFSKPMLPALEEDSENIFGNLAAGAHNQYGFFAIQKTGHSKFMVNINNTVYYELNQVQAVFKDNCFFDGKELIFYGIKDRGFYQFKLSL